MNNMNMRRLLPKQPSSVDRKSALRMTDGGDLTTMQKLMQQRQETYQRNQGVTASVMGEGLPKNFPTPWEATRHALTFGLDGPDPQATAMQKNMAAAASAPVAAPVAPTPSLSFQNGSSGASGQIPLKSFGLSTPAGYNAPTGGGVGPGRGVVNPPLAFNVGGEIPGRGKGDKYPALYEAGEFVVSNDMMDAAPELRGQLRGLREEVLADKGMTPAQADMKATRHSSLRAANGFGVGLYDDGEGSPVENRKIANAVLGANAASSDPSVGGRAPVVQPAAQPVVQPAARPAAPSGSGAFDNFFPGTRATLSGSGEDASQAVNEGNFARAAGHIIRGAAALPVALGDDTFGSAARSSVALTKDPYKELVRGVTGDTSGKPSAAPNLSANYRGKDFKDPRTLGPTPTEQSGSGASDADPTAGLRQVGTTGAFEVRPGVYSDKASLRDTERMLSSPAMSANDPGMLGIQARQDAGDRLRANKVQYDADVAIANKINEDGRRMNLEYDAKRGNQNSRRLLELDAATKIEDKKNANARDIANIGLQGQMYTADSNARTARAQALRDAFYKDREFEQTKLTNEQTRGQKASEQFGKDIQSFDPDGKLNPGMTAARQTAIRRVFPGVDSMTADARSKYLPEIETLGKLYERFATNPQMGLDKLVKAQGPGHDALPNVQGAKLGRQGYIAGKLTPGSESNGYYLTMPDGTDVPLGQLTSAEIATLEHATKTGNWRGGKHFQQ